MLKGRRGAAGAVEELKAGAWRVPQAQHAILAHHLDHGERSCRRRFCSGMHAGIPAGKANDREHGRKEGRKEEQVEGGANMTVRGRNNQLRRTKMGQGSTPRQEGSKSTAGSSQGSKATENKQASQHASKRQANNPTRERKVGNNKQPMTNRQVCRE